MSLINEMLNDLQKDQHQPVPIHGLIATEPQSFLVRFRLQFVISIITIALLSWVLFYNAEKTPPPILKEQVPSIIEIEKSTAEVTVALKAPTKNNKTKKPSDKIIQETSISTQTLADDSPAPPVTKGATKETVTSNVLNEVVSAVVNKPAEKVTPTDISNNSKRVVNSISTTSMIKISRTSQANKIFIALTKDWLKLDGQTQDSRIKELLANYSDQSGLWLKVILFLKNTNPEQYSSHLNDALLRFPQDNSFPMLFVKQYMQESKFSQALIHLNKIPKDRWTLSQYRVAGYLSQKSNNHQEAISFYNHLLLANPNRGDINMAVAISLESLKENNLAIVKFQRALEDNKLNNLQRQFIEQRIAAIQG
ncbi:MAG: tetratricopeptide repeat protein [Kangiellaceae bacterium]|nr:tetratricopeptide repeat protein [Kangiellaceae bacterium]